MKRTLIAAILALTATVAFAEPTLQSDENTWGKAPEAMAFVAGSSVVIEEGIYSLNP